MRRGLDHDSRFETGFIRFADEVVCMGVDTVSDRLRALAAHHETDESVIIQRALETGIDELYREMVITRYLSEEISRDEAIDQLGIEIIEDVDSAWEAVDEDVAWGLQA